MQPIYLHNPLKSKYKYVNREGTKSSISTDIPMEHYH